MPPQVVYTDDAMGLARLVASRRFVIQVVAVVAAILAVGLLLNARLERIESKIEFAEKMDAVRHEALRGEVHASKVAIDTLAAWYQQDYRSRVEAGQRGGK